VSALALIETARALVADNKGLLAMDESNPTCDKRFAALEIPQTEEARRSYRELIITTPGLGECISGVILFDETIREKKKDGTPFLKIIHDAGIIGEAWLLSDRDDYPSVVADGPLKGKTIAELMKQSPEDFLGKLAGHYARFPLLLKFLDVSKRLSVQVHPSDAYKELIPAGDTGKTEAWVVLEKGPEARIYAGLKPTTTPDVLRQAIANGTVPDQLASFAPRDGDGVFIRAGTVHSLSDVVVFEVQENSDVTFRLYDWDHIDPKTGQKRPLQIDQAMACINFEQCVIGPVTPRIHETKSLPWEKLIHCDHFGVWRISGQFPFVVGAAETCCALVCIEGRGDLEHAGIDYLFGEGDVLLLPAAVGACSCKPNGTVTLLEISLPEIS
jgi:mannose-6-phosphate isomerase